MRERLYKFALVLSVLFVADGLFMTWSFLQDDWSPVGYAILSYVPVFIPAALVALVIAGIYVHGVTRKSWTLRKAERFFFLVFGLAVAAKLILFIRRQRS
jgi:hypothetical protein